MNTIALITPQGQLSPYTLSERTLPSVALQPFNRIAYSAAHVVANPRAAIDPWLQSAVDWDATLQYRHHLWSLGLGVAEAMDTAQRGMGLDWPTSRELIQRTVPGARVASGCGTDHLDLAQVRSLDDVIRAYDEQIETIESMGGQLIIMASRALVKVARSPADYEKVYDHILSQVREPVILHWLGDMFDPALSGYWGHDNLDRATEIALGVMRSHASKVDGIKVSLLDKDREISLRRQLPAGVRMYTGDDFNYAELIAGDGQGTEPVHRQSDALLGIFDAIAPAASAALSALAQGHVDQFHDILSPTVPLSRHIFQAPTRFYKTGVVFMAWLNGHQSHFVMVGGQHSARSLPHLCELFRLADQAGLLTDPALSAHRMRQLLALHGID
jgi:Protein of unknown function (DUF993)